jgi:hypothetical protein
LKGLQVDIREKKAHPENFGIQQGLRAMIRKNKGCYEIAQSPNHEIRHLHAMERNPEARSMLTR